MAILGAGNLGTTLALMMWERGHRVILWTVEEEVEDAIRVGRENSLYLPGHFITTDIDVTMDLAAAMEDADVVALAIPSHAVRQVASAMSPLFTAGTLVVDFAKGLEVETGLRMSQVLERELPKKLSDGIVAVSGPSIASELVRKMPTAVEVSSQDLRFAQKAKELFELPYFTLHLNDDLAGVELGGVFKNIFAIGAGICDGLKMGVNTKAAYITRSLRELSILGGVLGARPDTFMGLSGLGDLIVTCASEHSRNRRFGDKVGEGLSVKDAQQAIGQVVEGIRATKVAHHLTQEYELHLPIVHEIYQVIYKEKDPREAVYGFIA